MVEPRAKQSYIFGAEADNVLCGLAATLDFGLENVTSAWNIVNDVPSPIIQPLDIVRKAAESPHLAGEIVIYASENASLLDGPECFLAITTKHFYRIHEGKLYSKISLKDVIAVSRLKSRMIFRDDKIKFGFANGKHDTVGAVSGDAIEEYMRILNVVIRYR